MRDLFDESRDEGRFDRGEGQRYRELTLSSGTLLAIFFGIAAICGLSFGLGFAVGRSGVPQTAILKQAVAGGQPASSAASKQKPQATVATAPHPQRPLANAAPAAAQTYMQSATSNTYTQPQVKPALAPQPAPQPVAAPLAQPALPAANGPMVQVAAVSHPEDADVLVSALARRGYPVSVRRVQSDSLLHVQVGPFHSMDEANRWKQKLLSDGYNAMLMP